MLDSGSLGAGVGRIEQQRGDLLSTGTRQAANNETDKMIGLMESEASRRHQSSMQERQMAANRALAEYEAEQRRREARLQQSMQPSGWEQLMGGIGSGVGGGLPFLLAMLGNRGR